MDLKLLRNLVRIMERGEVSELEIDDEKAGLRIHLKRGDAHGAPGHSVVMMPGAAGAPAAAPIHSGDDGGDPLARDPSLEEITSPMVGTFYRAASPGAENFTEVGTAVHDESVVCIIEAMKVMNEIKAEIRGEIVEILVENGEPVEFGQPLFLVRPS
ncbi:MAG: acetyl-CoA carboxylase biotin carboxyl carrier protein [Planctomycetota bacterium]|nr:acetyl-CoA carboxylase biotin carboxyl carrier protein [Planctomycetota bacterium]